MKNTLTQYSKLPIICNMSNRNKGLFIHVSEAEKEEIIKQMYRENFVSLTEFIRKVILDRAQKGAKNDQ